MNTRIITIELTRVGNPKLSASGLKEYFEVMFNNYDDVHVKVQDFEIEDDVYQQAIDTFGVRPQVTKAVEELMELGHALCRALQHEPSNVLEEMADVEIMMEQLKRIYGNTDEMKDRKLFRLEGMIYDKRETEMH